MGKVKLEWADGESWSSGVEEEVEVFEWDGLVGEFVGLTGYCEGICWVSAYKCGRLSAINYAGGFHFCRFGDFEVLEGFGDFFSEEFTSGFGEEFSLEGEAL